MVALPLATAFTLLASLSSTAAFPFGLSERYAVATPGTIKDIELVSSGNDADLLRREHIAIRARYAHLLNPEEREILKRDITARQKDTPGEASQDLRFYSWNTPYSASIDIGTPAQTFKVGVDTGSPWLWVTDKSCTDASLCPSGQQSAKYDRSASSTYQTVNGTGDLQFATQHITGDKIQDVVSFSDTLGGGKPNKIDNYRFVSATTGSISFPISDLSGLLGFSFPSDDATPFWLELAPFWKNQVFGIYLKNNAGPKQTSGYDGGILTLGGTRTDLYTGDVNWLNVVQTGSKTYWRVAIDAGIVNGGSAAGNAKRASVAGGTALVDTGASGINAPQAFVDLIYQGIDKVKDYGNGQFEVDCAKWTATNKTITIVLNGQNYNLGPDDLVEPVGNGICVTNVMPYPASSEGLWDWVLGASFLRHVYTIHSYQPARVGFARLVSDVQPSTSPVAPSSTTTAPASSSTTSSVISTTVSSAALSSSASTTAASSSASTTAASSSSSAAASSSSTTAASSVSTTTAVSTTAASSSALPTTVTTASASPSDASSSALPSSVSTVTTASSAAVSPTSIEAPLPSSGASSASSTASTALPSSNAIQESGSASTTATPASSGSAASGSSSAAVPTTGSAAPTDAPASGSPAPSSAPASGSGASSELPSSGTAAPSGTPISGSSSASGTPASGSSAPTAAPVSGSTTPSGTPASGTAAPSDAPASSGSSAASGAPTSGSTAPTGAPASGAPAPSGAPASGSAAPSGAPASGSPAPSGAPASGFPAPSGAPASGSSAPSGSPATPSSAPTGGDGGVDIGLHPASSAPPAPSAAPTGSSDGGVDIGLHPGSGGNASSSGSSSPQPTSGPGGKKKCTPKSKSKRARTAKKAMRQALKAAL